MKTSRLFQIVSLLSIAAIHPLISAEREFVPLFSEDGAPKGWMASSRPFLLW